jgi:hypothetical protein
MVEFKIQKKTTCLSRICCQIKHEDVPQNQWIQQTYWRDVIVQQLAVSARKNPGMIVKQKSSKCNLVGGLNPSEKY